MNRAGIFDTSMNVACDLYSLDVVALCGAGVCSVCMLCMFFPSHMFCSFFDPLSLQVFELPQITQTFVGNTPWKVVGSHTNIKVCFLFLTNANFLIPTAIYIDDKKNIRKLLSCRQITFCLQPNFDKKSFAQLGTLKIFQQFVKH